MNPKFDCVLCKGRYPERYCKKSYCPILQKQQAMFKVNDALGKVETDISSQAPGVFVGRYNYPNVNVGLLAPAVKVENADDYDDPRKWGKENYNIPQVVEMRSSLINSRFSSNVKDISMDKLYESSYSDVRKFVDSVKDVAMASKAPDMEINLHEKPLFRMNIDAYTAPTGPNAKLKNVNITSNIKVDKQVEKIVGDTDLNANSGIIGLFEKGFDENFLSRLLSAGNLGIGNQRKLVPTRWSITAVDDNVGKNIIDEIKLFDTGENIMTFGGNMGNYYLILLLPGSWSYELFEMYLPKASFNLSEEYQYMTDNEGYEGRKDYAEATAGGYYAARLPILEKLKDMKMQASVLVFRFITGEYTVPLGVWVVREAARKSVNGKQMKFENKNDMMNFARKIVKLRFNYNLDLLIAESKLLKNLAKQKSLRSYLGS